MNMNGVYPAPGYSQQIPYQASYGYNPYGNQQRIEQPQNYFQPAQTQQIQQPQMTPIGINGKIVPSVENITANDVPMDGSVAFFPKQDMSEIYAKSWNSDGTIRTIVFKPVLNDIANGLCDGFYAQNTAVMNGFHGVDNAICNLGYQTQQGFNTTNVTLMQAQNALQSQLANCCCETREAIQGVNYNMAQNTCALQNTMNSNTRDIIDSQQAGTRAILDYLCQEKISSLQAENNDLRRAASQDRQSALLTTAMSAQTQQIINAVNPAAIPAYVVPNPNAYAYGCGCNTGCSCYSLTAGAGYRVS